MDIAAYSGAGQGKSPFLNGHKTEIGDGTNTLLWSDCWLHGQRIADLRLDCLPLSQREESTTILFVKC
jgi:hypothetical protein